LYTGRYDLYVQQPGVVVRILSFVCPVAALVFLSACTSAQPVQLEKAFPGLTFTSPLFLTHGGDGSDRLYVVEQGGRILVFANDSAASSAEVFLDLSSQISSPTGEEGLLGLAFHPQYASNGYFYVNYTAPNPLRTVISRFQVSANDPLKADPSSEYRILQYNQPYTNHNGGMLAFGPDGFLYIGAGDGGSGGDPQNNGQNLSVLLGKILRIDVNDTTTTTRYRIPADNPWAGNAMGYRGEIWAYGLRNPWRFSFDPPTGALWAGDVGQDTREEIDIIEKGKNYGWRIMEGSICFNPASGCDQTGLTLPVKDYGRSLGSCVTGGYVYRGSRRTDLTGAYVYGDYVSGRIWMLRYHGASLTADSLLIQAPLLISSFGTDQAGELYVLSYTTGQIYRFNRSSVTGVPSSALPTSYGLEQNFPNPFNPSTRVRFRLPETSTVTLELFDVLGRRVETLAQGELAAGTHEAMVRGDNLASGVYYYRLEARGIAGSQPFVATRMLTLLR